MSRIAFPLQHWTAQRWDNAKKYFGAKRKSESGAARKHAGCDLMAPVGTPVVAVADGKVTWVYKEMLCNQKLTHNKKKDATRLCGSGLEVYHAVPPVGGTVLYGEVKPEPWVKVGAPVTAGQQIATVAKIFWTRPPMLHFEYYPNYEPEETHVMDQKDGPFQRAANPSDPSVLLDKLFLQAPPSKQGTYKIVDDSPLAG